MSINQRPDLAYAGGGNAANSAPRAGNKSKWPLLIAAAAGGAVVGGFMPMGLVESLSSAVGLAEMAPALAPPLGSTMRAILVLGGGVSAFALAAAFLGSKKATPPKRATRPHTDTFFQDDEAGELPMGHPASAARTRIPNARTDARQMVRDDAPDYDLGEEQQGGFLSRIRQSFSKLPLPRRFDEDEAQGGPIRDFSDLKRLRSGANQDHAEPTHEDARRNVRPIAAHAELGEPLPPIAPMAVVAPNGPDTDADFAAMERYAAMAAERVPHQAPALKPQPQADLQPSADSIFGPPPEAEAVLPTPITPAPSQPIADNVPPVISRDDESIEALVERLEHALHHARHLAAAPTAMPAAEVAQSQPTPPATPELDLAELAAEHRRAEEAQARAEAEERRRAEILAAQEAAKRAAEEADRAADEARRRAEDAQKLLASLGVDQPPLPTETLAPAPVGAAAPLRAVPDAIAAEPQPEMDEALRSALRTLRRMGNAN